MLKVHFKSSYCQYLLIFIAVGFMAISISHAGNSSENQEPPPVPVRVATVEQKMVSDKISLIGTTAAMAKSTVAAEVSGVVEYFPAKEGDFVKKGEPLVSLRSTELELHLKGLTAAREKIKANLQYAEKELKRLSRLKDSNSVAETQYDNAFFTHQALLQELQVKKAEIEQLDYEIKQKKVFAPFSGFVAKEHAQLGEWISAGGAVVTLLDLSEIKVTVDVPERYSVLLFPKSQVNVLVKSISSDHFSGKIYAILPQGDPDSRTFPVRINLPNPGFKIKSGMEAMVTFYLATKKNAILLPKDAIVTAGTNKVVFLVADGKAVPVSVKILGYYDGNAAVEGNLKPGAKVVIRGNERLKSGQAVIVSK